MHFELTRLATINVDMLKNYWILGETGGGDMNRKKTKTKTKKDEDEDEDEEEGEEEEEEKEEDDGDDEEVDEEIEEFGPSKSTRHLFR